MALATDGLAIGRQTADDRVCAQAANSLGLAFLSDLRVSPAIESWQASFRAARITGDPTLQMLALTNLPLALNLQGALEEGEARALEGIESANMIQYWNEHSKAISHLASIAAAKGQFGRATQYAQDTMAMVARCHYPWSGFRALSTLAYVSAARGRWDEANQALDILITPGKVFAAPSPFLRVYTRIFRQLLLGYRKTMLTDYVALLHDDLMEVATYDTYSLAPLCAMIELSALVMMPDWAERPARMLAEAMDRGVVFSSGWCFLIPRVLGVAAMMQEDWEQAKVHFQHAIAVATDANAGPELARKYLDYAQLLYDDPPSRDDDEGTSVHDLLAKARWLFYECHMMPYARHTSVYLEAWFPHEYPEAPGSYTNGEEPPWPASNGTIAPE